MSDDLYKQIGDLAHGYGRLRGLLEVIRKDDGVTMPDWMRRMVDEYVEKSENPKGWAES